MRLVLLELLLLVPFLAGGIYLFDRYLKAKGARRELKDAYFSGGSLDKQTRRLPELPPVLTHGEEIYRNQGGGVYLYVGTLADESSLSYEV